MLLRVTVEARNICLTHVSIATLTVCTGRKRERERGVGCQCAVRLRRGKLTRRADIHRAEVGKIGILVRQGQRRRTGTLVLVLFAIFSPNIFKLGLQPRNFGISLV